MRIKNTYKVGKKLIPQKDIILNHHYRLTIANDNVTHQVSYQGDITSSINFEQEVPELEISNVYSSFSKYLDNILSDEICFELIYPKSYGKMKTGYKIMGNDLLIIAYGEDELLLMVFYNQSRRGKTIFGAFKSKQLDLVINRTNKSWRLIDEY